MGTMEHNAIRLWQLAQCRAEAAVEEARPVDASGAVIAQLLCLEYAKAQCLTGRWGGGNPFLSVAAVEREALDMHASLCDAPEVDRGLNRHADVIACLLKRQKTAREFTPWSITTGIDDILALEESRAVGASTLSTTEHDDSLASLVKRCGSRQPTAQPPLQSTIAKLGTNEAPQVAPRPHNPFKPSRDSALSAGSGAAWQQQQQQRQQQHQQQQPQQQSQQTAIPQHFPSHPPPEQHPHHRQSALPPVSSAAGNPRDTRDTLMSGPGGIRGTQSHGGTSAGAGTFDGRPYGGFDGASLPRQPATSAPPLLRTDNRAADSWRTHEPPNGYTGHEGGYDARNGPDAHRGRPAHTGGGADRDDRDMDAQNGKPNPFVTAREQLVMNNNQKNSQRGGGQYGSGGQYGGGGGNSSSSSTSAFAARRSLGARQRPPTNGKFVPPFRQNDDDGGGGACFGSRQGQAASKPGQKSDSNEFVDERLKNIDPKMIELITNEIMDNGPPVDWNDIAGLEFAKKTIMEIVVWPMQRPDIFHGLRGPPKGLLLFGPPGTGKTLIGKCIASQSGATFFSISASSLTSKYVGEGEKMVRALFAVARCNQPAVIFIDEIDSLLSQRSESEHEASRRIKTEFLVQLDGAATSSEDRLLVVGATNRPQELDEAARRRLVKRLYVPLPDNCARRQIIANLLSKQSHTLAEDETADICRLTEGYSGADMTNLCKEAALGPIRSIMDIRNISADQVRPIAHCDFVSALRQVRASVSPKDLDGYIQWNGLFGSCPIPPCDNP